MSGLMKNTFFKWIFSSKSFKQSTL